MKRLPISTTFQPDMQQNGRTSAHLASGVRGTATCGLPRRRHKLEPASDYVTFLGVGKSFIDCNNFEHGLTDVSDISNLANSTVSLPNTNLSGFCVMPLRPKVSSLCTVCQKAWSMLSAHSRVSSTHLVLLGMWAVISSNRRVKPSPDATYPWGTTILINSTRTTRNRDTTPLLTIVAAMNCHVTSDSRDTRKKCGTCGAQFARSCQLKSHVRTHTGEKPYKCDMCGAQFEPNGILKRHIRTHTGEKPYKCDMCGAQFAQNGALKSHVRTHTGDKPYKCDMCGAQFASCGALKNHIHTHTGEKPYQCNMCGAQFAQSGVLKRHIRTHTADRRYTCDMCRAQFAENGSLTKHFRIHTGKNLTRRSTEAGS